MNEFRKDFQEMQGRFSDRSGHRARDENVYWTPIVVTRREIEAEADRLASLPRPANGRRESLIVHPLAEANAPGFAPGIQVKLSVLKPGRRPPRSATTPPRSISALVVPAIRWLRGSASLSPSTTCGTIPLMHPTVTSTTARIFSSASPIRTFPCFSICRFTSPKTSPRRNCIR